MSYSNDSSGDFRLPYSYLFTILLCWCGPGYRLRGRALGYGFWVKDPDSVTITHFLSLLVKYLVLWIISIMVRLTTWKQGWIYRLKWMWFQWSMEHFLWHSTWLCIYFRLLLGLPSSGIMWCVVLLLFWCGLVFGPNWGFIKCPHTQSYVLVEVLDIYGKHLC